MFFFDNHKNAKLMKVSFPIMKSFLKNKVWRDNNKFNQAQSLCPIFFSFSPNDSPSKTVKNAFLLHL